MRPADFWTMTLAEWRASLDGLEEREYGDMRKRAWGLSHLLIAAGCDAEKVTASKLLGETERKARARKERPKPTIDEIFHAMKRDEVK